MTSNLANVKNTYFPVQLVSKPWAVFWSFLNHDKSFLLIWLIGGRLCRVDLGLLVVCWESFKEVCLVAWQQKPFSVWDESSGWEVPHKKGYWRRRQSVSEFVEPFSRYMGLFEKSVFLRKHQDWNRVGKAQRNPESSWEEKWSIVWQFPSSN